MIIWGINDAAHDASLSVIKDGEIVFAGHSERYSKEKNDWFLNSLLVQDALEYGNPDKIAYYEKSMLKASRLVLRGGLGNIMPSFKKYTPSAPVREFFHHESHAAAGYYTSSFNDAVIVVLDAIGEWETSSIWIGKGEKLKKVSSKKYPYSFGLFYSAFTDLIGLLPNQEEYIMMGMAAYGDPNRYLDLVTNYFPNINKQKYNFHSGIVDWPHEIEGQDRFDIAAAVQKVYESRLLDYMSYAKKLTGKDNLVFMGGCALNSKANTLLWEIFKDIWIMPNPGDAGSSLGAAALMYGRHLDWSNPYLGHSLGNVYPVDKIVKALLDDKVAPVATGRAEYGPRALGNRSILADPRDPDIKDKVNRIKKRELFRPFAPVVLEECASEWFEMHYTSPYMQYTPRCLKPDLIPSVVHADGTSRVQTVNESQHPGLYAVLKKWHALTGVPVLLNTSLNIKGQPLLNDRQDIADWEDTYDTKIIT
jgi:carbamoyltransferase